MCSRHSSISLMTQTWFASPLGLSVALSKRWFSYSSTDFIRQSGQNFEAPQSHKKIFRHTPKNIYQSRARPYRACNTGSEAISDLPRSSGISEVKRGSYFAPSSSFLLAHSALVFFGRRLPPLPCATPLARGQQVEPAGRDKSRQG